MHKLSTHTASARERKLDKVERNVLQEEMRKVDGCDVDKFGTLYNGEITIAILGDRWSPQTTEDEGDTIRKTLFM